MSSPLPKGVLVNHFSKSAFSISLLLTSLASFAGSFDGKWQGTGIQTLHLSSQSVNCTELVMDVEQSETSLKVTSSEMTCGDEVSPARTLEFVLDGSKVLLRGHLVGTFNQESGLSITLPIPNTNMTAKMKAVLVNPKNLQYMRDLFQGTVHVSTTSVVLDLK